MRTREQLEDSIQLVLRKCLPNMPPSNIRPAYQKTKLNNPMAVNVVDATNSLKDGLRAVENTDDIVYFWLHFDPLDLLSTEVGDTVSSVIPFKLTVYCYGSHSLLMAIKIKAFMRTPDVLTQMLGMQAALSGEPILTTFSEEVNGEWWERNDVEIGMDVLIDDFVGGEEAALGSLGDGTGYSNSTGGVIVVKEV